MKCRLTRPYYDGEKLWPEGSVLDLAKPPTTAELLEPKAKVTEEPEDELDLDPDPKMTASAKKAN